MLPKENYQLSQKEQSRLGLPQTFSVWSPFPFGSMNQQSSRIALQDNEFFWRENFIKIGDGKLRTLWNQGNAVYTTAKTIVYFFSFNIGSANYIAVFLNDGTAVQVNTDT